MIFDDFEEKLIYERLIIGVEEPILIKDIGEFIAKIDSGNSGYNVIHGVDFTRQGNILLFKTIDRNNKEHQVSKQIIDTLNVNIGGGHIQERPVIELDVKFAGDTYDKIPFSVCDRSSNKEKILISKDFVKNKLEALIDVGATNITKSNNKINEGVLNNVSRGIKNKAVDFKDKIKNATKLRDVDEDGVKNWDPAKEKGKKLAKGIGKGLLSFGKGLLAPKGGWIDRIGHVAVTGQWIEGSGKKDKKILNDLEKQELCLSKDKKAIPEIIRNQVDDAALRRFFARLQKTSDIHNAKGAQLKLEGILNNIPSKPESEPKPSSSPTPTSVPESEETTEDTPTPTPTPTPAPAPTTPSEEADKPVDDKKGKNVIKETGFEFNNGELSFKNFSTRPCMISQYTYNTLWNSPKKNERIWSGAADAFKEKENQNINQQNQQNQQPQEQQSNPIAESFIFEAAEQSNNQTPQQQQPQTKQPKENNKNTTTNDNKELNEEDEKAKNNLIKKQKTFDAYEKMISNKNFYSLYVCLYKITLDDYSEILKGYNKDENIFTVLKSNYASAHVAGMAQSDTTHNTKQLYVYKSKKLTLPFGIKALEHDEIKKILPQSLNERIVTFQSQHSCNFKDLAKIALEIDQNIANNDDIFGFVVYAEGDPKQQRKYQVYSEEQYWVKPEFYNNCFSYIINSENKPEHIDKKKKAKENQQQESTEEKHYENELEETIDNIKNEDIKSLNKNLNGLNPYKTIISKYKNIIKKKDKIKNNPNYKGPGLDKEEIEFLKKYSDKQIENYQLDIDIAQYSLEIKQKLNLIEKAKKQNEIENYKAEIDNLAQNIITAKNKRFGSHEESSDTNNTETTGAHNTETTGAHEESSDTNPDENNDTEETEDIFKKYGKESTEVIKNRIKEIETEIASIHKAVSETDDSSIKENLLKNFEKLKNEHDSLNKIISDKNTADTGDSSDNKTEEAQVENSNKSDEQENKEEISPSEKIDKADKEAVETIKQDIQKREQKIKDLTDKKENATSKEEKKELKQQIQQQTKKINQQKSFLGEAGFDPSDTSNKFSGKTNEMLQNFLRRKMDKFKNLKNKERW